MKCSIISTFQEIENRIDTFLYNFFTKTYSDGLKFTPSTSKSLICVFFPSDPDELIDQLKLLYLEKVGGKENPQRNEQIIAITDKLLEYKCITTNQHQTLQTIQSKKDLYLD